MNLQQFTATPKIWTNHALLSYNQESLMNAMNEEMHRLQEQVYYGQIGSHTDILDKFLSESGYKRYNPAVSNNSYEHFLYLVNISIYPSKTFKY